MAGIVDYMDDNRIGPTAVPVIVNGPPLEVHAPAEAEHHSALRQLVTFAAIGSANTVLYAVCYLGIRPTLGAQLANVVASLLCAFASTAANQRVTFEIKSVDHPKTTYAKGITVYLIGLATSSAALFAISATHMAGSTAYELAAVIAVSAAVGLAKFIWLRTWVFHQHGWRRRR